LVVNGGTTNTIALPPDGILHYTTITVRSNGTLRFSKNALNTPVYQGTPGYGYPHLIPLIGGSGGGAASNTITGEAVAAELQS
jgi:hypothetical protein